MRVAVVLFPGTNCEAETKRAVESAGMEADIVRWNEYKRLPEYDGYILPGGFSYEDRVRAGVIAAQDLVMDIIRKEADKGKPVLGICNGAQILIESGIVPGPEQKVQMALAPNRNPHFRGYYCTWVSITPCSAKCIFTRNFRQGEVIPIPIAHAEGRFITSGDVLEKLIKNEQIAFRYCNKEGKTAEDSNPNGSVHNIAGVCNPAGNVLAMMPHPERASWKAQLPGFEAKPFSEMVGGGPGRRIFESMREYMEEACV